MVWKTQTCFVAQQCAGSCLTCTNKQPKYIGDLCFRQVDGCRGCSKQQRWHNNSIIHESSYGTWLTLQLIMQLRNACSTCTGSALS
jgi:hypothetical protein